MPSKNDSIIRVGETANDMPGNGMAVAPRHVGAHSPRSAGGTPIPPVAGYALGEVIGRGGMGEVVLARDLRIERDVAIKRMRGETHAEAAVARFMREAKIQARLDHPAVVFGAVSPTWGVVGDTFATQPATRELGRYTALWFVLANAAIIGVLGLQSATLARANLAFERQIHSQRWHYSQLIPRTRAT